MIDLPYFLLVRALAMAFVTDSSTSCPLVYCVFAAADFDIYGQRDRPIVAAPQREHPANRRPLLTSNYLHGTAERPGDFLGAHQNIHGDAGLRAESGARQHLLLVLLVLVPLLVPLLVLMMMVLVLLLAAIGRSCDRRPRGAEGFGVESSTEPPDGRRGSRITNDQGPRGFAPSFPGALKKRRQTAYQIQYACSFLR
jgi:hypothetical protein